MNPWDTLTNEKREQTRQLFIDMLPYYGRISVYELDKVFINANIESCLRIALAGKQVMLAHTELTPEEAIFSDDHFSALLQEAWREAMDEGDKRFLNSHLQEAAECFRMGFMMADLPEM